MKFMKLGTRPDSFFSTSDSTRSVSSEVPTDIKITVHNTLFLLHKFPLLSKCLRLRRLSDSADGAAIDLPDFPGGAEAFETCAKFCYGITITISAINFVVLRCAAEYLQMTDSGGVEPANLVGKLDVFFKSCILRRWKDALLALQATRRHVGGCEELGVTSRCVDALAAMIVAAPSREEWGRRGRGYWAEDIAEFEIDIYWRIMVAVKLAGGMVASIIIGEALQLYARRWLPEMNGGGRDETNRQFNLNSGSLREITTKRRLQLERLVALLPPPEKGVLPCSFLLGMLRAANALNASSPAKLVLARRAGMHLDEANVSDLLIPSLSYVDDCLYDVDVVVMMLEEFLMQGRQTPTSSPPPPPRAECIHERRRRSRSAEDGVFEGMEIGRRSSFSSASHSAQLRVAKLIDGYLQEIAQDVNLPMEKLIALAEAVPEFARIEHDGLYKAIDVYLRVHPDLDKNARKKLCRILNCRKLSMAACMHAAENERLPLRVVVQVLFFEQARSAAASGRHVKEIPGGIKALLAAGSADLDGDREATRKGAVSKLETIRMKLEEAEDDVDGGDFLHGGDGLMRSSSSRFRALCSIPSKPKKMISKLWAINRSLRESRP